jgi:ABC-type transporter Mla subunit MlaD
MFFAKLPERTPSQKLSAALNNLNETLDAVRTASTELSEEAADLDARLVIVERNRGQAETVVKNLAALLGV